MYSFSRFCPFCRFFARLPDGPGKVTLVGTRADKLTSGMLIDNFGINSCEFFSEYLLGHFICQNSWWIFNMAFDFQKHFKIHLWNVCLQMPTAWETRKENHSMGQLLLQNQDMTAFPRIWWYWGVSHTVEILTKMIYPGASLKTQQSFGNIVTYPGVVSTGVTRH